MSSTFTITYRLTLSEDEQIDQKIERICLEQSVELPREVLSDAIRRDIPGTLVKKHRIDPATYEVTIAWPVGHIGDDIVQFLNLLFGNISLTQGIRIQHLDWDALPEHLLPGPSYGIRTLRHRYKIHGRPLSASVLKPMGSPPRELAEIAYQMGCGGLDIVKDDHGLTNQPYAEFRNRIQSVVEAERQARMDSGNYTYYFPHITADFPRLEDRYRSCYESGADGVLICPHLTGLSALAHLVRLDLDLPIIAHPAFSGSLVQNPHHGMTPAFLYGQLWRALGADMVIFPNTGGRFSFALDQCRAICEAARTDASPYRSSFPMIGGGIELEELPGWIQTYGEDSIFLIGSSLYQHAEGLRYASRQFSELMHSNSG